MHLQSKQAYMCTQESRLAMVFDTCWRDSVLRSYSIFRIRPGHSKHLIVWPECRKKWGVVRGLEQLWLHDARESQTYRPLHRGDLAVPHSP